MGKRHAFQFLLTLSLAAPALAADRRREIAIADDRVFPENITASRDGTIWFGSVGKGTIYRALPGENVAVPWIAAGTSGMRQSLGLWADDRRRLLWVCVPGARATDRQPAEATAIRTFDLKTSEARADYGFAGGGRCNDLTVSPEGIVYASDFDGGRVMRLMPGDTMFRPWLADARLISVDGIALLGDGHLYADTYRTNLLFRIAIGRNGEAGPIVPIATSRPLAKPDGMRAVSGRTLLLAEGEGRLAEVRIDGDTAVVRTIRDGLTDSPAGVAIVGKMAFLVQTKWAAMKAPADDAGRFGAIAIPYPAR